MTVNSHIVLPRIRDKRHSAVPFCGCLARIRAARVEMLVICTCTGNSYRVKVNVE